MNPPPDAGASTIPAQEWLYMRKLRVWFVIASALLLGGCGYNAIQQQDEAVKAAWSEVANQYQRRADLVANMVNTVKGCRAGAEGVHRRC